MSERQDRLVVAAQDAIDRKWRENPRMMAEAATKAVVEALRDGLDGGRFADWSNAELAAQCRMQARDMLDPEYSSFMAEVADRLSTPTEQKDPPHAAA